MYRNQHDSDNENLILNHEEKVKNFILKMVNNPIIINKYKDSSYNNNYYAVDNNFRKGINNKSLTVKNSKIKSKEIFSNENSPDKDKVQSAYSNIINTERSIKSTNFNSENYNDTSLSNRRGNILNTLSTISANKRIIHLSDDYNNYESLKISKTNSCLESLYNTLLIFFRKEKNWKSLKSITIQLTNKLKWKNNAIYEYLSINEKTKSIIIKLIEDILQDDYLESSLDYEFIIRKNLFNILKFLKMTIDEIRVLYSNSNNYEINIDENLDIESNSKIFNSGTKEIIKNNNERNNIESRRFKEFDLMSNSTKSIHNKSVSTNYNENKSNQAMYDYQKINQYFNDLKIDKNLDVKRNLDIHDYPKFTFKKPNKFLYSEKYRDKYVKKAFITEKQEINKYDIDDEFVLKDNIYKLPNFIIQTPITTKSNSKNVIKGLGFYDSTNNKNTENKYKGMYFKSAIAYLNKLKSKSKNDNNLEKEINSNNIVENNNVKIYPSSPSSNEKLKNKNKTINPNIIFSPNQNISSTESKLKLKSKKSVLNNKITKMSDPLDNIYKIVDSLDDKSKLEFKVENPVINISGKNKTFEKSNDEKLEKLIKYAESQDFLKDYHKMDSDRIAKNIKSFENTASEDIKTKYNLYNSLKEKDTLVKFNGKKYKKTDFMNLIPAVLEKCYYNKS